MNICIYCKKEITPETESIEHVFPASFGCPDDYVREPVLLDDSHTQRYLVHILIVERVGNELGAIISLFNQGMAYRVLLSGDMGPFWEETVIGHSVNPLNGQISPLGHIKY